MKTPSDVVVGIIAYCGAGTRITGSIPKWGTFFHQASQNPRYKKLFEGFLFDTNGNYPTSDSISDAKSRLFSFLNSGVFTRDYLVRGGLVVDGFTKEEEKLLKELAEEFKKLGVSDGKN